MNVVYKKPARLSIKLWKSPEKTPTPWVGEVANVAYTQWRYNSLSSISEAYSKQIAKSPNTTKMETSICIYFEA